MSLIQVTDLTFAYEGSYDPVFEHVSFQLDTDWKLGFTGRNGRGKTTFLKLLMGKEEYSGKISADVEFDYFPFQITDSGSDALAVAYEIEPGLEYWQLIRELSRLDIKEETLFRPFHTLSGGEQTKILLAVLFLKENHFLLIDEPTNHLDKEARRLVGDYLAGKRGFILVSHDRAFLDRCTDHTLAISKTQITVTRGNFSTWYENKERQDHFEMEENARLRRDIKRLTASARQAGGWADEIESAKIGKKAAIKRETTGKLVSRDYVGEKSRRMQMRRKNLERRQQRAIEEKEGLLKDVETVETLKLFPGKIRSGGPVVRLKEFGLSFSDEGTEKGDGYRQIFDDFCLEVMPGEQIMLEGKNGCGKSSILKKIAGETETIKNAVFKGEFWVAPRLRISYVPQDTSFLNGSLKEFVQQAEREEGIDESLFFALLRKLDMPREQFEKRLEHLSAGQRKKVLLAKSLCVQADLYLWDEPLNYIDIYSRMQIEEVIVKNRPTMILVEHDERFAKNIAARSVPVLYCSHKD